MTVPTNTYQVYTQTNIREDLSNSIYNVDPIKTPLLNMAKKAKAAQTYHEWDTDSLAAQNVANAAVEGDTPTPATLTPTVRLGNYTQISVKTISLSGTSQVVTAAGGTNKKGYQLMKKSKELKRDMEGILTYNNPKAAGTSTTARNLAGLPAWLGSNTVFGSGGANPASLNGTVARTYGADTAVTEAQVKTVLQLAYKNSGECPEYCLLSPANKQNVSAFAGPGTRFISVKDKTLATAVDVYQSDFGEVKMIPDIFLAHSADMFFVQPAYIAVAYLRPFTTIPLAKVGDSDQWELVVEYTLEQRNEKAHAAIYDTTG